VGEGGQNHPHGQALRVPAMEFLSFRLGQTRRINLRVVGHCIPSKVQLHSSPKMTPQPSGRKSGRPFLGGFGPAKDPKVLTRATTKQGCFCLCVDEQTLPGSAGESRRIHTKEPCERHNLGSVRIKNGNQGAHAFASKIGRAARAACAGNRAGPHGSGQGARAMVIWPPAARGSHRRP